MQQTSPVTPEPPTARRSIAGWLLGVARAFLALAAVLLALMAVVAAAALLAGWTAAAVRHVVPVTMVADTAITDPGAERSLAQRVIIWSHSVAERGADGANDLSSGRGREAAAASADDTPLREFYGRCIQPTDMNLPAPPAVQDIQELGRALYWERQAAAGRIEESYATLQLLTWASVLIGLITTVLVGLRGSTLAEGNGFWARCITVFAIAFPAIGTAVAAVAAFYSPREELARSSQQLAGLRQVHAQIAMEVRAIPCTDHHAALEAVAQRYPDWLRRWRDAQAVALAATAAAFGEARGSGGAGSGPTRPSAPAAATPTPAHGAAEPAQ